MKENRAFLTNYMLGKFWRGVKEIISETVTVAPQRTGNGTKKCKGESNVFASHGEKKTMAEEHRAA